MTNKTTKRALFTSFMALLLCCSMLVGTTFAWFTDSVTSAGNKIIAGTLDVQLHMYNGTEYVDISDSEKPIFGEGGLIDEQEDVGILWEPGKTQIVYLAVKNAGNLALKYNILVDVEDNGLVGALDYAIIDGATKADADALGIASWNDILAVEDAQTGLVQAGRTVAAEKGALESNSYDYFALAVHMKEEAGNEYKEKNVVIDINIVATQLSSEEDSFGNQYDKDATYPEINTVDTWDGTADISWYLENPDATEYTLSTAEALAGLATLVDGTATIPADATSEITLPVTFDGKIVKLEKDVDLYCEGENGEPISFDPIGYGYDVVFKGTFDGQGHTIFNLYQNGWALGLDYSTEGGGLFASVVDATIKNVAIDGAEIVMECIDMGVLVGYSYGNCTYENISVSNSTIANYQRYTGGVVGEVNGTQTFKNVDVASDVVVSSLWGDFDCSLGGIVGGKYGEATLTFEDCDVACELNTYNDVTSSYQWYAYRRAGMLIGNSEETVTAEGRTSATASYLTATNCTVTYGDWANYTYCEFAGTSWPYVRVQGGYSCDPYSNPRYGVATDANGNKAVDDNHVHNDGEDHNTLLVFDQLFGGGQGVYGTATHEGVTVTYNNK